MGKHLSADELDNIQKWKTACVATRVIHDRLLKARRRKSKRCGETGPDITTVRRAVRGTSFKRARVETRGATKILSTANLHTLDRAHLRLIKKAANDSEVHWEDVMRMSIRQLQDNYKTTHFLRLSETSARDCHNYSGFWIVL